MIFTDKSLTIRQNMDQEDSILSPSVPVGETVSSMTVPDLSTFSPATISRGREAPQAVPYKIMWAGPSANLAAEATHRMPGSYYY